MTINVEDPKVLQSLIDQFLNGVANIESKLVLDAKSIVASLDGWDLEVKGVLPQPFTITLHKPGDAA